MTRKTSAKKTPSLAEVPLDEALTTLVDYLMAVISDPSASSRDRTNAIHELRLTLKDRDAARPLEADDEDPVERIRVRVLS